MLSKLLLTESGAESTRTTLTVVEPVGRILNPRLLSPYLSVSVCVCGMLKDKRR